MIYFIAAGRWVKIGVSGDVENRLRELQVGNLEGLKVLGTIDGEWAEERALHVRFAHLRGLGEWFRLTPELRAWIRTESVAWKSRRDSGFTDAVCARLGLEDREIAAEWQRLADETGWALQDSRRHDCALVLVDPRHSAGSECGGLWWADWADTVEPRLDHVELVKHRESGLLAYLSQPYAEWEAGRRMAPYGNGTQVWLYGAVPVARAVGGAVLVEIDVQGDGTEWVLGRVVEGDRGPR